MADGAMVAISHAIAVFCIQVPTLDAKLEIQSSENILFFKGAYALALLKAGFVPFCFFGSPGA
jgi:hypothetical protein